MFEWMRVNEIGKLVLLLHHYVFFFFFGWCYWTNPFYQARPKKRIFPYTSRDLPENDVSGPSQAGCHHCLEFVVFARLLTG